MAKYTKNEKLMRNALTSCAARLCFMCRSPDYSAFPLKRRSDIPFWVHEGPLGDLKCTAGDVHEVLLRTEK